MSNTWPSASELAELGRVVTDGTEQRNKAIRQARINGMGVREIARTVGLSPATVLNIITPKQRRP